MDQPVEPGHKCPTCDRKVPFPRSGSSPKSRTKAYKIPNDEYAAHMDVLDTASRFLGCYERPFAEFWTVTYALALVLQNEEARGAASRG